MEYISIKGAAQRLGVTEKEVHKLVEEGKLDHQTKYGVTTVTLDSVYAHNGIKVSGKQTKKHKGGRPPATVTHKFAADLLSVEPYVIADMAKEKLIEEIHEDGISKITRRSIDAYKKGFEVKKPKKEKVEDKYNDNFDMSEERALNDGKTPPEYENESEPQELTHDPLVDFTDFTGMPDAEPKPLPDQAVEIDIDMRDYLDSEEHKRKCIENEKWKEAKAKEAEDARTKEVGPQSAEETITISKQDFHASLTVAAMRAELQVYRSLKSFERR